VVCFKQEAKNETNFQDLKGQELILIRQCPNFYHLSPILVGKLFLISYQKFELTIIDIIKNFIPLTSNVKKLNTNKA